MFGIGKLGLALGAIAFAIAVFGAALTIHGTANADPPPKKDTDGVVLKKLGL